MQQLLLKQMEKSKSKKYHICQNHIEKIRHLIFDCVNVLKIWKPISEYVDFNVQWKYIII